MGQTLEDLGVARREHLEQVRDIEAQMIELVEEGFAARESLRSLAQRAGVTHPTIAKWLSR